MFKRLGNIQISTVNRWANVVIGGLWVVKIFFGVDPLHENYWNAFEPKGVIETVILFGAIYVVWKCVKVSIRVAQHMLDKLAFVRYS